MGDISISNVAAPIGAIKGKGADTEARLLKLKKACQDFESIFIYYMLKTMRSASASSTLFGKGMGAEIFMQMFDQGLSEKMATTGQFGIWQNLYDKYSTHVAPVQGKGQNARPAETPEIIVSVSRPPITVQRPEPWTSAPATPPTVNEIAPEPDASSVAIAEQSIRPAAGEYDHIIDEAAEKHAVDPQLIRAVIMQESGGNPRAVSAKGAKGLMQLMDGTAAMLGVTDPFDVRQNIFGGVKYLSLMLKKFGGDIKKALAAYNAGPGAVEKYGGIPPYEQTRNYVAAVIDRFSGLFNSNNSR